jgi:hypothetical protein
MDISNKKKKKGVTNNREVVLKINLFTVIQPSTGDDKQSVIPSLSDTKGRKSLQRSRNKVDSVLSDGGMKCKRCGLVYYAEKCADK